MLLILRCALHRCCCAPAPMMCNPLQNANSADRLEWQNVLLMLPKTARGACAYTKITFHGFLHLAHVFEHVLKVEDCHRWESPRASRVNGRSTTTKRNLCVFI